MPLKITNATRSLVLIRLRSGETLYLGVGQETDALAEHEIVGNPRVDPLVERGLISVEAVPADKQRRGGSATKKASSAARKGR